MTKLNVISALRHHQVLSRNPELAKRHGVDHLEPEPEQGSLLSRLRHRVFSPRASDAPDDTHHR
jgi:hypothetical protein